MRGQDLWEAYPVVYHMAWGGSWESIRKNGLLSVKRLLKLYQQTEQQVEKLTRRRRAHWVKVRGEGLPSAVLRDQKPMTDEGVRRALEGKAEPWQWYELINSMVFFWPTKERLRTMILASAYEGVRQDVLLVDTRKLLMVASEKVRLSPMNSGCTKPYPHPRDLGLFKAIPEYPFENRRGKYGTARAVAEICVVGGVDRIAEIVIDVKSGNRRELLAALELLDP